MCLLALFLFWYVCITAGDTSMVLLLYLYWGRSAEQKMNDLVDLSSTAVGYVGTLVA